MQIAAGHCHSIAVLDNGEVYSWGNGSGCVATVAPACVVDGTARHAGVGLASARCGARESRRRSTSTSRPQPPSPCCGDSLLRRRAASAQTRVSSRMWRRAGFPQSRDSPLSCRRECRCAARPTTPWRSCARSGRPTAACTRGAPATGGGSGTATCSTARRPHLSRSSASTRLARANMHSCVGAALDIRECPMRVGTMCSASRVAIGTPRRSCRSRRRWAAGRCSRGAAASAGSWASASCR